RALDVLSEMARDHLGAYFALEKLVSEGYEGARKALLEAEQNLSVSSTILLQVARQNQVNALMALHGTHGMRLMGKKGLKDWLAKNAPLQGLEEKPVSGTPPSLPVDSNSEGDTPLSPPREIKDASRKKSSFLPLSLDSANKRGGLYQLYRHFPRFEAAVEKTQLAPKETRKLINTIREKAGDRAKLVFLQLPEFLGWMADAGFSSQQILHLAQPFAERGLSHFQYHGLPQFLEVAEGVGLSVFHRFELLRCLMQQDFDYDVLHFNRAANGLENLAKVELNPEVIFSTV